MLSKLFDAKVTATKIGMPSSDAFNKCDNLDRNAQTIKLFTPGATNKKRLTVIR